MKSETGGAIIKKTIFSSVRFLRMKPETRSLIVERKSVVAYQASPHQGEDENMYHFYRPFAQAVVYRTQFRLFSRLEAGGRYELNLKHLGAKHCQHVPFD